MTRRFVIQHRTTKRYLAANPSKESAGLHEVVAPINAVHFGNEQLADHAHDAIGEFKDTYVVVPVNIETAS